MRPRRRQPQLVRIAEPQCALTPLGDAPVGGARDAGGDPPIPSVTTHRVTGATRARCGRSSARFRKDRKETSALLQPRRRHRRCDGHRDRARQPEERPAIRPGRSEDRRHDQARDQGRGDLSRPPAQAVGCAADVACAARRAARRSGGHAGTCGGDHEAQSRHTAMKGNAYRDRPTSRAATDRWSPKKVGRVPRTRLKSRRADRQYSALPKRSSACAVSAMPAVS